MAFRIAPPPTFGVTVSITLPGGAGVAPLPVTYRHKPLSELRAWIESAGPRDDPAFLAEVIDSWGEVVGADGQAIPYSVDALRQLLDAYPRAGADLFEAYLQALTEARAKN